MKQRFLWLGSALLAVALLLTACPSGSTVKKGDLAVAVLPAEIAATAGWTLTGPDSYSEDFTGAQTVEGLAVGDYTITAKAVTGYKDGATAIATVKDGETATASLTLEKKPDPVTTGTLSITVTPVGASVVVTNPDATNQSFDGSKDLTLAPGTYKVSASKAGYLPSGDKSFEVKVGETTDAAITLTEVPKAEPVAGVTLSRFYDEWGKDFVTQAEEKTDTNGKDVLLLAAQTEDSLCFDATAVDAAGDPVAGAEIKVQLTGNVSEAVVLKGCAINGTQPSITTASATQVTGENGKATFTLVGTYGVKPSHDTVLVSEPNLKVIVEASNITDDAVSATGLNSAWEEFKVWFYNIDHLHHFDDDKDVRTTERWDNVLTPTRENSFKNSAHPFETRIWQKQPPLKEGFIPMNIDGIMRYTLSGADASKVKWVDCTSVSGLVCNDADGVVGIDLKSGVTLDDLPIEVEVNAVLTVRVNYGNTYRFQLKSYKFTKRWTGAFLKIDKRIDHHVVTWKGSSHTLAASGAVSGHPWVAKYTITVKNESQQDATNVTVTDALPPELGYVTNSAKGGTANYDSVLHELTWVIGSIEKGTEKEVTFEVYARQKPGFCWNTGAYYYSARKPKAGSEGAGVGDDSTCTSPYSDPYKVINGKYDFDVTAEADNIDPIDYEPIEKNVVLHVVRPLFRLDKFIVLPNGGTANSITVKEDDNVEFGFKVTNMNRYTENGYKLLQDEYSDYTNTKGDQVHDFGPTSKPGSPDMEWDNPYGNTITLEDWFDEGLDFDHADIKTNWVPAKPKYVFQGTEPLLGYKKTTTVQETAFTDRQLFVTAAQPSPDDGWLNCAFMDANNLNQLADSDPVGGVFHDWWQAQGKEHPWHKFGPNMHEIVELADVLPAGHIGYSGSVANHPSEIAGQLGDCVVVHVDPRETDLLLTLSTIAEHDALVTDTAPDFADQENYDPVESGDTYWYYFLVNASYDNVGAINEITFEVSLAPGGEFTGNTRVLLAGGIANAQWDDFIWANSSINATALTTDTLTVIEFPKYDGLLVGQHLLYAVEVTADTVANRDQHTAKAEVLTSTANNQGDLDEVQEQTVIEPVSP